jgi:glutathione S-transferase
MTKPEIIGSERSSYTRIVRMVCEEKGIAYDLTETLLGAAEIRALHPFGKMPILRHGDLVLCESKAIATYLDRAFDGPQLIPSELRLAALTEQWVSLINTAIDPLLVRRYLLAYALPKTADGKPDRALIEALLPDVRAQLALLDDAVAATNHLVGGHFTLADVYLLPMLHYLKLLPESGAMLAPSTALGRYLGTHAARPSYIRTIPPLTPPRRAAAS